MRGFEEVAKSQQAKSWQLRAALSLPVVLAEFARERDACKTGAIAEQFVLQIRA